MEELALHRKLENTTHGYYFRTGRLELNPLITLRPKHGMPMILIPTAAEGSANSWEHLLHTSSTGRHEAAERKGCLGALLSLFGV